MKVYVSNIPVYATLSGTVTVPDGLEGDALQNAIAKAVLEGEWEDEGDPFINGAAQEAIDAGWEFEVEPEK